MTFKSKKHINFIQALPPPDASTRDVQRWIMSWFAGSLDKRLHDQLKLLLWDGKILRDLTERNVALQLRWVYTLDGTTLRPDSSEDKTLEALVWDIEGAKYWETKVLMLLFSVEERARTNACRRVEESRTISHRKPPSFLIGFDCF
jgi:hypothetical protein